MGILGARPPDEMLARLREQARAYEALDPGTPVLQALHLVTVVAQRDPGQRGLYRGRLADSSVAQVISWAEPDSLLAFLDIQPGRSTVRAHRPVLVAAFTRRDHAGWLIPGTTLALLAGLGATAAAVGGASTGRGALRVAFWGMLAMAASAMVGRIFETTVL